MIKTKQKTIRVFEIDNSDEKACCTFLDRNSPLLKDYLIFFTTNPSDHLASVCAQLGLDYFIPNNRLLSQKPKSEPEPLVAKPALNIISRHIRSGEEIESEGDLIICGNVHNGARIHAEKNLMIFGRCEGRIECEGEYLILMSIYSSQVVFSGQIFSTAMLEKINQNPDVFKLITRSGELITIKEIE